MCMNLDQWGFKKEKFYTNLKVLHLSDFTFIRMLFILFKKSQKRID